jgi:predicted transcriptional regulator
MQQSYAQRIDELLNDGYLVNDRGADVRLTSKGVARLHALIDDGFMIMARRDDNVRLTNKGVAVLLACADRPVKPRREIKRVPVNRK